MPSFSSSRVAAASSSSGSVATTAAAELTETIEVSIAGSARAGPYYPGSARAIFTACTGTCKFQIRGTAGGSGATAYRDLAMSAEQQTGTATKAGIVNGDSMPHEFYLLDTSGSTNAVTMYILY